jgi:hypothetical protein
VLPSVDVTRELLRLRRQLVTIYLIVIVGSLFTLERVLRGVPGHTTRFFLAWLGVFTASLVAVVLGRRIRARMATLLPRI